MAIWWRSDITQIVIDSRGWLVRIKSDLPDDGSDAESSELQ